jgi:hypothetical protein
MELSWRKNPIWRSARILIQDLTESKPNSSSRLSRQRISSQSPNQFNDKGDRHPRKDKAVMLHCSSSLDGDWRYDIGANESNGASGSFPLTAELDHF